MVNSIIILFVILGILWLVKWTVSFQKLKKLVNEFPGEPSHFLLGDVAKMSTDQEKIFLQIREYAKKFPSGYRMWGGFYPTYHLIKAEDVEVILSNVKHNEKEFLYIFLYDWLQKGLLTSGGEKWKQRRKLLTPAFHFNILSRFVTTFGEHTEIFLNALKQECYKEKTEITKLVSNLTLNLICETAMGITLSSNEDQVKYKDAIHSLASIIVERVRKPWFYNNFLFSLSSLNRKQKKYVNILHSFSDSVIKEREKTFKESDIDNVFEEENAKYTVYSKKRFAMLDLMISIKRKTGDIDDEGIREEVNTFMFEGHDTVSSAISYIIFVLANYKDIQKKVVKELDSIFQGSSRNANYQDLQNMHYLELCIKETLRLYPSVPLISRVIRENVPIRNGKYILAKDSQIYMHIYDLHRDPEVFPNPDVFDPNRFLPENCRNRHPYAYIPFSAGPRNCIGQRFAMLEVKSVVSGLLRNFQILPVDKLEDLINKADIVLRPTAGIHVKFRQRNAKN